MSWATEYNSSLKLKEVEEILDLYFYRPLAFLLVKAVYRTRVTPNQLTITSILLGIVAGFFYSVGKPSYIAAGALLYLISNIFDCSDGQLARLKHNGSAIGRIIDGVADMIAFLAVYFGIAFGFANHQDNTYFWWLMLLITGFSSALHSVLVDFYRNRFLDYFKWRKNNFEEEIQEFKNAYTLAKQQKGKWFERSLIRLYLKITDLQRVLTTRSKRSRTLHADPQDYYRKNRIIIRLWLLLGPTTQITNLIICSLFQRIDLFIWIVLFGFNGLAAILWVIQQVIDRTFKAHTE